jgi:hypothetical protein
MMKHDTYVCDTCHKALDIPVNSVGITALPRCKITLDCVGTMNKVSSQFPANGQYHDSIDADTWFHRPQIYDHLQIAPRKVWTIKHNLGASSIVHVKVHDAAGDLVPLHDFKTVTSTETVSVLEFSSPYTGRAQCTGRQSTSVAPAAVVPQMPAVPLTINKMMVIATMLRTARTMELSVQPNPLRPSDIVEVDLLEAPSVQTPWAGATYVVIANQRYFVRYVNVSDVLLFHRAAATFFISKLNGASVVRGQSFVLLSDDPYTHVSDRILDAAVDMADLAVTKQSNTLLTQDGLLCTNSALSTVYPTLKVA